MAHVPRTLLKKLSADHPGLIPLAHQISTVSLGRSMRATFLMAHLGVRGTWRLQQEDIRKRTRSASACWGSDWETVVATTPSCHDNPVATSTRVRWLGMFVPVVSVAPFAERAVKLQAAALAPGSRQTVPGQPAEKISGQNESPFAVAVYLPGACKLWQLLCYKSDG